MDFRYLEAFYQAARFKNFSKAALQLKIAPSAITRQIKLFELSCNEEVFLRNTKTVELTPYGKILYQKVLVFLEDESNQIQKIKIGSLQSVFEFHLQEKIQKLKKKIDEISISSPKQLEQDLIQGSLDLIITNKNPNNTILKSHYLYTENYSLISKYKIDQEKIYNEDWIINTNFTDQLKDYIPKIRKNILYINSFNATLQLVEKGIGVSVIPNYEHYKVKNLHSSKVNNIHSNKIYLVTKNYITMPKILNEIIELIK